MEELCRNVKAPPIFILWKAGEQMVTALKVTNYLGDELLIDPFDPESSGFLITDIRGITPIKADINFTSITTNDGGLFNSARIDTRNITMKLVYFPKPTIEDTRLMSYKFFPVKKEVTLEFETDTRKAEIKGYVESNDINIFTKTEYSAISILCPDPYFYSTSNDEQIDVTFSGATPRTRFPFPTNSDVVFQGAEFTQEQLDDAASEQGASVSDLNPVIPKMIFGTIEQVNEQVITYNGDAEIGAEFIMRALGSVGDVTLYNSLTNESMVLSSSKLASLTGSGIISGDVITVTTYRGNKGINLLRNGVNYNILNCLNRDATWLQIRKGDNVLAFSATSGAINLQVEIKSKTIYEGL